MLTFWVQSGSQKKRWRLRLREKKRQGERYFLHVQGSGPQMNVVAVDAIPIPNDIPRHIPLGENLDDLLGSPSCGRVLSNIELQHLATAMLQHDKRTAPSY
ncbi:MAG: hypothetical protein ACRD7E_28530 [Bryobacteraceae bacterium]